MYDEVSTAPAKRPMWRRLRFAAVLCAVLVGLLLVPGIQTAVQKLDYAGAYFFNSLAGKSPVFDRLILFISDDDGRERFIAAIIIWFFFLLWLAPNKYTRAKLLGTLLFCLSFIGVFLVADSYTNDIIPRRSPSYTITPFNSLREIYKWNVDISDKRSFPNSEAMVFLIFGFILLRLRHRLSAIVLIAAGLILPLGRCVVGSTWPTDIYLGSLPVAFLASAVAVETPLYRLRQKFISWSSTFFDQAEKLLVNWRAILKYRKMFWSTQNVFYMEAAIKHFARTELPKLYPPKSADSPAPKLEVPLGGLRSVIRVISLENARMVLRTYPTNRIFEAEQHLLAANTLHTHNVRAPHILHYINDVKKSGLIFLLEEFVDGECIPPENLTEQHLEAAATEIAALHSVKNLNWGPLNSPRGEKYYEVALRRAERHLGMISRNSQIENTAHLISRAGKWFRAWEPALKIFQQFTPVHGKLHRENCLFEKSGRFCLLDNTTMEWGVPLTDIVTIHQSLCNKSPELIEVFDRFYFAKLDPADAEKYRRLLPLYYGFSYLSQIVKYAKRLNTPRRGKAGGPKRQIAHYREALEKLMDEFAPPRA